MSANPRKVAVLIACYNRVAMTIRSLAALTHAADGIDYDVFLVDDGSTDGTTETVRTAFPRIHVIQGNGKLFWAKSMHLAWEIAVSHCDYDYYLWLNDDLILKPDALAGIFADYRAVKSVVVGACSEDAAETFCSYGVSDNCDQKILPNGSPQQANGWLNGNLVLVPKLVYEEIGMISADYSHARADYDYAERLKKAGIPFYCSSHYVGVCHNDFYEKMAGMNIWQKLHMLWKPGYFNLHDLWLIRRRYHGITAAILSCAHLTYMAIREGK